MYYIKEVTYNINEENFLIKTYPTLFRIEVIDHQSYKVYKVYTTDKRLQIYLREVNLNGNILDTLINICLRQQKLNKILDTV